VFCSALALTVEELRALLAVVLGLSNLVLLFVNKALAHEQQSADKAQLNLSVLQKQVHVDVLAHLPTEGWEHRSSVAAAVVAELRMWQCSLWLCSLCCFAPLSSVNVQASEGWSLVY